MQNLRDRRLRLKTSAIFNAKKQALQTIEARAPKAFVDSDGSELEEEADVAFGREKVDLTVE